MTDPDHFELEEIRIRKKHFGPNAGRYEGTFEFVGAAGKIEVALSPEISDSYLAISRDIILKHVDDAARELKNSLNKAIARALESRGKAQAFAIVKAVESAD